MGNSGCSCDHKQLFCNNDLLISCNRTKVHLGPSCIATDTSFCWLQYFSRMTWPAEKDYMLITILHFDCFRQLRTSFSLIPNIYYIKHPLFGSKTPSVITVAAFRVPKHCIHSAQSLVSVSVQDIPVFCFWSAENWTCLFHPFIGLGYIYHFCQSKHNLVS